MSNSMSQENYILQQNGYNLKTHYDGKKNFVAVSIDPEKRIVTDSISEPILPDIHGKIKSSQTELARQKGIRDRILKELEENKAKNLYSKAELSAKALSGTEAHIKAYEGEIKTLLESEPLILQSFINEVQLFRDKINSMIFDNLNENVRAAENRLKEIQGKKK